MADLVNGEIFQLRKQDAKHLTIAEMKIEKPDLKDLTETRPKAISAWLADWIDTNLQNGNITGVITLPTKRDFAYFLGVSLGTVHSAFADLESKGYVVSRQCIGTIIVNDRNNPSLYMRKNTHKLDVDDNSMKKYLIENHYLPGDRLPAVRRVAKAIGRNYAATRLVLLRMVEAGILEHDYMGAWSVKSLKNVTYTDEEIKKVTVMDAVYDKIVQHIQDNCKVGDRFLSLQAISKKYNVSMKCALDVVKKLTNDGILIVRRGNYGSYILRKPNSDPNESPEKSIFATSENVTFYYFERIYKELKHLINAKYQPGDRMPNMYSLACQFEVSTSVIRLAVQKLVKEGIVTSKRGRFAGTVVVKVPEVEGKSQYQWLSVNPVFVKSYHKVPAGGVYAKHQAELNS